MKAKKMTLRERAEIYARMGWKCSEYEAGYLACQSDNRGKFVSSKDVAGLRKFLKEIATEKICHQWCAIGCYSCRARTFLGKLTPERKQL